MNSSIKETKVPKVAHKSSTGRGYCALIHGLGNMAGPMKAVFYSFSFKTKKIISVDWFM